GRVAKQLDGPVLGHERFVELSPCRVDSRKAREHASLEIPIADASRELARRKEHVFRLGEPAKVGQGVSEGRSRSHLLVLAGRQGAVALERRSQQDNGLRVAPQGKYERAADQE